MQFFVVGASFDFVVVVGEEGDYSAIEMSSDGRTIPTKNLNVQHFRLIGLT